MNILPNQETTKLNFIQILNNLQRLPISFRWKKPSQNPESRTRLLPSNNNFFIDLLNNQQSSITGPNNDRFESMIRSKLSLGSIFYSYLTGFVNSIKESSSSKNDCPMVLKTLSVCITDKRIYQRIKYIQQTKIAIKFNDSISYVKFI